MPSISIQSAFQIALSHHQAGRLGEAEAIYRQILSLVPNHADALHLLGLILHQRGQNDSAVDLIRRSLLINPNNPAAHANLGEVCRSIGQFDFAIASYQRALELKPDEGMVYFNLGNALTSCRQFTQAALAYRQALKIIPNHAEARNNLGVVLAESGHFDEAIAEYRNALQLNAKYPEAYNNLGNALRTQGCFEEAVIAYRSALSLNPGSAETYLNLGNVLRSQGLFEEALIEYHRSLHLKPELAEARVNIANILKQQGSFDEAILEFRRALQLKPNLPEAQTNLGNALKERGLLGEAIAAYRQSLLLLPDNANIHNNLGEALRSQGRLDEAIAEFACALRLDPAQAQVHCNLGIALMEQGRLDEAVIAFRRALQLKPEFPGASNNLGDALKDQGNLGEAIELFRQAVRQQPENPAIHSNLVYALHFDPTPGSTALDEERERWNRHFSPECGMHRAYNNGRELHRRLRVGYVSADFRDHVVGRNVLPLMEKHDPSRGEILLYSAVVSPDGITERFRSGSDRWRNILGVSDEALAEMIRQDGIDILVDLTQHMAGNRLPLFARMPAPLTVSFAGYPESTGAESIGHRISDQWLEQGALTNSDGLPVKTSGYEQVYLIDSFWCYNPCGMEVAVNELPARSTGAITFGSLNNFCKVNEPLLKLWARVIGTVAESRLVILTHEGSHRERTLQFFEREGIKSDRVEFATPSPRKEYLELYHQLDIVLDTFPYNGHTTSLDALWMGVPVISLCGERPVSRAGLSQLSNLGLPELVAFTEDRYVDIAAQLANDIPRLKELRATLRGRMEKSVLMDGPHFARQIEACYHSMWRHWCESQVSSEKS